MSSGHTKSFASSCNETCARAGKESIEIERMPMLE